jgi:shikimate kinase
MVSTSRIFLVGPMGAGKTTIGKRLAKALRFTFVDCDHELERRTGVSVALIFEIEGEVGFRLREKRLLDELTQSEQIVLATGGGAVLDADNRQALHTRGFTVYLHAGLDELVARTRNDVNRPLLNTPDRAARLGEIVAARETLYRETAHFDIDTGTCAVGDIIKRIRETINA